MDRAGEQEDAAARATEIFEEQLAVETLASERRRVLVLAATFLALLALAFLSPATLGQVPERFAQPFHGLMLRHWLYLLLAAAFAYESTIGLLTRYADRIHPWRLQVARYGNAVIEVSIPSAMILLMAATFGPAAALTLPPVFLYFIFIILAALRLDLWLCIFTGLVAALEYALLAVLLLGGNADPSIDPALLTPMIYVGKPVLLFAGGVVASFVTHQIKKQVLHAIGAVEERNRILGIFGQHVSPAVVSKLVEQAHGAESEVRRVCVLFLDIRGFTAFSEDREPGEVIQYLNDLFGFMVTIVNDHGGIVNKFLGDGFMALFGAPIADGNESAHAVGAALEISRAVEQANAAGTVPQTRIGIGVHVGEAITGTVGSVQRREYSVIGDVVNLASRVESLNKQFDSQILVTEAVYEALGDDRIDAERLGPVQVRGRERPVLLYRLA